jgi:hypothetical protein
MVAATDSDDEAGTIESEVCHDHLEYYPFQLETISLMHISCAYSGVPCVVAISRSRIDLFACTRHLPRVDLKPLYAYVISMMANVDRVLA